MLTNEDLLAIRQIIKEEAEPIKTDVEAIKEHLERIDEHLDAIEDSFGAVMEWADNVAIVTKVPFASGHTNII